MRVHCGIRTGEPKSHVERIKKFSDRSSRRSGDKKYEKASKTARMFTLFPKWRMSREDIYFVLSLHTAEKPFK